ncbi:HTTM domain-containing protein [Verrucomicrobiales bacterium BCK34]|nr:HTTM domain-containing protein [Verrucomicrobiales bacterium BCK34]
MTDLKSTKGDCGYRPFSAFALIWAVTTLAHQLAFTFWAESWQGWILVITAAAVIFEPSCVLRFGAMVFASLLNLWHKLPFVPNHILFEGMLHLIMVLAFLGFFFFGPGVTEFRKISAQWLPKLRWFFLAVAVKAAYFLIPGIPHGYVPGALTTLFMLITLGRLLFGLPPLEQGRDYLSRFAPVIRVAIIIMYFWAGTQKLNRDYLNPEISCAAKLHTEIAAYFGPLIPTANWALHGAIWGSYLFEFGIPILLLFRRTRFAGFLAAVFFHLWLSIHPAAGIFSFSSLILAVLILFLPLGWGERLQGSWNRQLAWLGRGSPERGRKIAKWLAVGGFFVTLIIQGVLYLTHGRTYETFFSANRVGFVAFFIWGCWIGGCYLLAGWQGRKEDLGLPNRARWSLAWIGLLPVLLNGVYPWVGGRTQTSFSMYSNLRSEGESNHLFFKRKDFFKLQGDMIEVLNSEPDILAPSKRPRGIQQFANIGHRIIPWFEFRRLVSEMPGDFEVKYSHHGEVRELGRKEGENFGDEAAFEPLPLFARKFLWFRRLESLDGPMCCTH